MKDELDRAATIRNRRVSRFGSPIAPPVDTHNEEMLAEVVQTLSMAQQAYEDTRRTQDAQENLEAALQDATDLVGSYLIQARTLADEIRMEARKAADEVQALRTLVGPILGQLYSEKADLIAQIEQLKPWAIEMARLHARFGGPNDDAG